MPPAEPARSAADRVIGADGLGSLVARKVEAPTLVSGRCSVAHVFGYAAAPALSGYHWYFGRNLSGGVIPTNDGLACIVASVPTERFDTEFRFDLSAGRSRWQRWRPGLAAQVSAMAASA